MKIRMGYVTNSSSTNFIVLSKKKLTVDYLYKKLGFKLNSVIKSQAEELCQAIINGTINGFRWLNWNAITEESIKEQFGEKAARIFRETKPKGYFAYVGHTSTDNGDLTCFFTMDSFEIDENDFYLNARHCVY